jgi:hypothetical protein
VTLLVGYDRDHGAGTILYSFFLAAFALPPPQIGIADDQTRNRLRKRHDQPITS